MIYRSSNNRIWSIYRLRENLYLERKLHSHFQRQIFWVGKAAPQLVFSRKIMSVRRVIVGGTRYAVHDLGGVGWGSVSGGLITYIDLGTFFFITTTTTSFTDLHDCN